MTSPLSTLDQFVAITFVADADTPAASQPYAGRIYYLPPEYLTAIGSGPTSPGYIDGIRGYVRTNAAGQREWLMTNLLDAATVEAIRLIPATGWVDTNQRQVYRQQARRLIGLGVSQPEVVDILTLLYNAAVANYRAAP